MKTKPVSHKSENTFRFQTFSERIKNVNIDVVHRIRRVNELPEEADSFFAEALQKWEDLNCTEDFDNLKEDIGSLTDVQSLAQVLYKQKDLVQVLLKALSNPNSLALDVTLELVVALARDLHHEFYPYFPELFDALVNLLSTKDADLLERIFTCLAYLFKFLWRCMINDIQHVYSLFSRLLSLEQKEYICNFAAESFSFLVRKVPDQRETFVHMFRQLNDHPEQVTGVGRLLFEVMKGVKQQLHSCTKSVLTTLLELLGEEGLPLDLVQQALTCTFSSMIQHVSKEHCIVTWEVFSDVLHRIHNTLLETDDNGSSKIRIEQCICRLLELYHLWIDYKNGVLISTSNVLPVLFKLLKSDVTEIYGNSLLKVVSGVLNSRFLPLSNEAKELTQFIFNSKLSTELIFNFIKCVFLCSTFERYILPSFLDYCSSLLNEKRVHIDSVLKILVELVLCKSPVPRTGQDMFAKTYSLSASSAQGNGILNDHILSVMESNSKDIKHGLHLLWASLIIIPHLEPLDKDKITSVVKKTTEDLLSHILDDVQNVSNDMMHVLCLVFLALQRLDVDSSLSIFSVDVLLKFLNHHPSEIAVLQLVDFVLTLSLKLEKTTITSLSFFKELFNILQTNLASPYHQVRLLTLRIFSTFDLPLKELEDGEKADVNVFQLMLQAETIPVTIQDYREKLKVLQKISFGEVQKYIPVVEDMGFDGVPVTYLVGNLYINFQWLWQPIQKLIESHARGLDAKVFWDVLIPQLKNSMERAFSDIEEADCSVQANLSCGLKALFLQNAANNSSLLMDRPDFANHLCLVWKSLELFPDVAEPRNRELAPLVLKCINEEYFTTKPGFITVQDIQKKNTNDKKLDKQGKKKMALTELEKNETKGTGFKRKHGRKDSGTTASYKKKMKQAVDDDSKPSDLEEVGFKRKHGRKDSGAMASHKKKMKLRVQDDSKTSDLEEVGFKSRSKSATKVMLAQLAVFAKFQNPKSVYREKELHDNYMQLLMDKNQNVQKLAFDCLVTYKQKFLVPYKENFYRLLDDKTFKTEVTLFSVDSENGVVQNEHRPDLFPILLRILYGKMTSKTGPNTSGKAHAGIRRAIVLRFLAGCQQSELQLFVDLVFHSFKQFMNLNPLELVHHIEKTLTLSSVMPIRCQSSSLNMLGIFMKHLGNLAPGLLPQLLNVLLSIAKISQGCLEKREELETSVISRLKSIRSIAFQKLIQFFRHFDNYNYSINEIDAIFDAYVWSLLPRLENESMNSPSPLLRLISVWCENPRYFVLLSKKIPGKETESVVSHVVALYAASQTQPAVLSLVTTMIHNLLSYSDFTPSESTPAIPSSPTTDDVSEESQINFGTKLLLPHVLDILKRLRMELEKAVKNSKKTVGATEMDVLANIGEHVTDSQQSTEVISLLITSLFKVKNIKDEVQCSTLKSVRTLIKQVECPEEFLPQIAPLFSSVINRHARNELCFIVEAITSKEPSYEPLSKVVNKMNSWNPNLLEEPDYPERLEGYKMAKEMISEESNPLNSTSILVIIYNCSYFLRCLEDLSLRDGAVFVLQKVCTYANSVITKSAIFKTLILDGLLVEIRKGLKEKSELVRRDFVHILASLLKQCGAHPCLENLSQLGDSDPDVDFWENICHIQLHRRSRAMTRFARALSAGTLSIPPFQLTSFLLPIVSSFLFDKSYSKHTNLTDGAIEAIGAICQNLPWHRYEAVLKYYLGLLPKCVEFHKTVVKVVVSVLNAFHFDLSNSRGLNDEVLKTQDDQEVDDASDSEMADIDKPPEITKDQEMTEEAQRICKTVLNADMATKVHRTIAKNLLPELRKSLTERTKSDEEHKMTKQVFAEDEEILRIPIAVAVVKLLQVLPHGMLEENLPGILLRVCDFLKSRAESIREAARETLVKIMVSIGPSYVWYLLHEMKGVMKKGYQVHVMLYTLNTVLAHLSDHMKSGDLDNCIDTFSELCHQELFSTMSEEKEVGKILGKLKEARTSKSYVIYHVLGKFVTESAFMKLVQPLQEKLLTLHSHKMISKVQECFQKIVLGLADNAGIKAESVLICIHKIVTDNMPDLNGTKKKPQPKDPVPKIIRNPDTYLIPKEPPRSGNPAKSSKTTNNHILVEFAFKILHFLIKRKKLSSTSKDHLEMLDPFIPFLAECLTSQYVKLISIVLRCISGLLYFPLPSFRNHISSITNQLFILLNKYAGVGLAQGDNFEMVVMCFKTLTVIIRDIEYHKITDDQLRVLLSYIEQDIYDRTRQATAFTLLKAILSRKLESPELQSMMRKIAETSVTSEIDHIRVQCRQVYLQYFLDYPHGKKLRSMLAFIVGQLEYQIISGRESVLELLSAIIQTFPTNVLGTYSGLLFVPLAARLVNDISPDCRRLAAQGIKKLISRIENEEKDNLLSIVVTWMSDEKVAHQRLGAQLCGIFAEVEKEAFERHLDSVLPVIQNLLCPEKHMKEENPLDEKNADHLLYHLLNCLLKILASCPIIRNKKYLKVMNNIWEQVKTCILYPHAWVRFAASQLFGLLFSQYSVQDLTSENHEKKQKEYLLQDVKQKVRDLSSAFCTQLREAHLVHGLGDQIAKNMVYLGKVCLAFSGIGDAQDSEQEEVNEEDKTSNNLPSFEWLLKQMCRAANAEMIKTPRIIVKRSCVFKWFAAMCLGMDEDTLSQVVPHMLLPLCRTLGDNSSSADESLRNLAQEVTEVMKKLVGMEKFAEMYAQTETQLARVRAKRKRERAIQAVTDPSKMAKRKIRKHEMKKEAKKRKFALKKGKKHVKKK